MLADHASIILISLYSNCTSRPGAQWRPQFNKVSISYLYFLRRYLLKNLIRVQTATLISYNIHSFWRLSYHKRVTYIYWVKSRSTIISINHSTESFWPPAQASERAHSHHSEAETQEERSHLEVETRGTETSVAFVLLCPPAVRLQAKKTFLLRYEREKLQNPSHGIESTGWTHGNVKLALKKSLRFGGTDSYIQKSSWMWAGKSMRWSHPSQFILEFFSIIIFMLRSSPSSFSC